MSLPIRNGPVSIGDQLIPRAAAVNDRNASVLDRMFQAAYRAAYCCLRLWWLVRRPHHDGALVALWHDGRLLMVRSSYRRRWDLPGGGVQRGESALAAARREIREEIALTLPEEALRPAYQGTIFWEHRHDRVTIFETVATTAPVLRVDRREIVAAVFRDSREVDATALSPHLARYLEQRREAAGDATACPLPPASASRSAAPI
jgi:8-oxo-dGTP diphosphatase